MRSAYWTKHLLRFSISRGTSRGRLTEKPSWFIVLKNENGVAGIGECGLLPGLSADDRPEYESVLEQVVQAWITGNQMPDLLSWPSIRAGLEMAEEQLIHGGFPTQKPSEFLAGNAGIPINGLIWMNPYPVMLEELKYKLKEGFNCIKIKIGAVDFDDELSLIRHIRKHYGPDTITIRVDANGAFTPEEAPAKLEALAKLDIHSIEQPIEAGQWREMEKLCRETPLPIALDEELIGLYTPDRRAEMMTAIKPQAVILKPSLIGGFSVCDEWIALCNSHKAFWWATSALESNIGLNAIAQYTASKNPTIAQGLGTGGLYVNNFDSPLEIRQGAIYYNAAKNWNIPFLK